MQYVDVALVVAAGAAWWWIAHREIIDGPISPHSVGLGVAAFLGVAYMVSVAEHDPTWSRGITLAVLLLGAAGVVYVEIQAWRERRKG